MDLANRALLAYVRSATLDVTCFSIVAMVDVFVSGKDPAMRISVVICKCNQQIRIQKSGINQ